MSNPEIIQGLVSGILWEAALKGEVAEESWQIFEDSLQQAQKKKTIIFYLIKKVKWGL